MIDVHCPHCGEPWDNDCFHDMQEWNLELTYMQAAQEFQTLGCNLFYGKDTPCDAEVVDERAARGTRFGMELSPYPEEWGYNY